MKKDNWEKLTEEVGKPVEERKNKINCLPFLLFFKVFYMKMYTAEASNQIKTIAVLGIIASTYVKRDGITQQENETSVYGF